MLSTACNLIVVGVTEKSFNNKLLWTTSEFMDSEEKAICSDDGCKTESYSEPQITILKSTVAKHILPSVHSAVAAASSPLFSSYRSVFQNWKHSVPKLYKYPSSDIEVVVYRKNGEVEKLSNHKGHSKSQRKNENDEATVTKNDGAINCSETSDVSNETSKGVGMSATLDEPSFIRSSDKEELDDAVSVIDDECATASDESKNETELNHVPLEHGDCSVGPSSSFSPRTSQVFSKRVENPLESNPLDTSRKIYPHSHEYRPICEFIFNVKTRHSSVPLLEKHTQIISKDNSTQTVAVSTLTIKTETRATQVSSVEIIAINRLDAGSQCDYDQIEFVTNCSQTDSRQVGKLDFSQIYPSVSASTTQTDKLEELKSRVTKSVGTENLRSESATQTNKLEVMKSLVSQSVGTESQETESATQTDEYEAKSSLVSQAVGTECQQSEAHQKSSVDLLHTVEWHTNVPCSNESCQTDPPVLTLGKENFCQAVPEVGSKSTQVENDITSINKHATTNTEFITKDVGVQLSASCCYFTKKRERKKYEIKLDALRKEIRSFYQNKHHLSQSNPQDTTDKENVDSMKSEGLTISSGSGFNKYLEANDDMKPEAKRSLEEETKYLDELSHEVDKLLGNTSLLKSNLESLEDTSYYEDDWLVNN